MAIQALLWVAFNAFWANLALMLSQSWGLGPFWAGAFGLVGLVGACAATLGGRAADRLGSGRVLTFSVVAVTGAQLILIAAPSSMASLVAGVIVLDLGCQSALVANQTRVLGLDAKAQGRINTLYMVATFLGGALGASLSGWLMARYGWLGVASLGAAAGIAAGVIHAGSMRR
jgi:predicted MFS family arabinose efflux permease